MAGPEPEDIGEGIYLCAVDGDESPPNLSGKHRFLDVLWLPCPLDELRPQQIFVINRFRESRMKSDGQFRHASLSRCAVLSLLQGQKPASVLEVGCGKFPLAREFVLRRYSAIEIDGEAIEQCRTEGYDVRPLKCFLGDNTSYDLIVSLYALHFAIDAQLVRYLHARVTDLGCLVFNVIVDDSVAFLRKLALLSAGFPVIRVVKEGCLSNREFFFVLSREDGAPRAEILAAQLSEFLKRQD